MKKVLIISYAFAPQNVVGATRPFKFSKYLPGHDWQPYVLTKTISDRAPIDHYACLETKNPTRVYRHKDVVPDRLEKEPIYSRLVWSLFNRTVAFPDNQLLWSLKTIPKAISLIRQHDIDIIFCTTPPQSSFITALWASKATGKPLVADLRDLWTLHEYFYVAHRNRPCITRFEQWLEHTVMKEASLIILNTPRALDMMANKYPHFAKKFTCLTNGFDEQDFSAADEKSFHKFTMVHAGSFYLDRNPLPFLEGLSLSLKKDASLRDNLQVIFAGRNSRSYERQAKALGVDDIITYYDQLPKEQLFQYTKGAHLLLLFLGFAGQSDYVVPAKLYEYIAVKRPIMAFVPWASQTRLLLEEHGLGTAITSHDPEAASQAILKYFHDHNHGPTQETLSGQVAAQYEYKYLTAQLSTLLDNVLSNR